MGKLGTAWSRLTAAHLPPMDEMEAFGSEGEEYIYRLLCEQFDCVIRNVIVPHKSLFLEKDFMVLHRGVGFVIEVKNWKGEVGCEGDVFYQNKDNGTRKTLKSPVGTTRQFLKQMREFYRLEAPVFGMVVFCSPDAHLSLPEEIDGIACLPAPRMVPYIKSTAKEHKAGVLLPIEPSKLLRCTRFYSVSREFSKGILADSFLDCFNENGDRVQLDTTCLSYLSVEAHHLRMRDKLRVTYINGATDTFYNADTVLTVSCLDGSYQKIALHRIRHIVF